VTLAGGQRQEFALSKSEVSIGRAATSDIQLTEPKVSARILAWSAAPTGVMP